MAPREKPGGPPTTPFEPPFSKLVKLFGLSPENMRSPFKPAGAPPPPAKEKSAGPRRPSPRDQRNSPKNSPPKDHRPPEGRMNQNPRWVRKLVPKNRFRGRSWAPAGAKPVFFSFKPAYIPARPHRTQTCPGAPFNSG